MFFQPTWRGSHQCPTQVVSRDYFQIDRTVRLLGPNHHAGDPFSASRASVLRPNVDFRLATTCHCSGQEFRAPNARGRVSASKFMRRGAVTRFIRHSTSRKPLMNDHFRWYNALSRKQHLGSTRNEGTSAHAAMPATTAR